MKVVFTKPALAELEAIFNHIAERNPAAAFDVVERIELTVSQLALSIDWTSKIQAGRAYATAAPPSLSDILQNRSYRGSYPQHSARSAAAVIGMTTSVAPKFSRERPF